MKIDVTEICAHLAQSSYGAKDSIAIFEFFINSMPAKLVRQVYDRLAYENSAYPNDVAKYGEFYLKLAVEREITTDSRLARALLVEFPELAEHNFRCVHFRPISFHRDKERGVIVAVDPANELTEAQILEKSNEFYRSMLTTELEKILSYGDAIDVLSTFKNYEDFFSLNTIFDTYSCEKGWDAIEAKGLKPITIWFPKIHFENS